jgi:tetratricopeptide (TPR) repeat protein
VDYRQELIRLGIAEAYQGHRSVALQCYYDRVLDAAITHYKKAAELAEKCSYTEGASQCRHMVGVCLFQIGQLKEALTELSPFLEMQSNQNSPDTVFEALTIYIQAAQRLPATLDAIDKVYRDAEELLRSTGHVAWRHELLVHRARLELNRGEIAAALSAAQEAVALKSGPADGGYGQVWDFHFDGLVDIALSRWDADAASSYIEQWTAKRDVMPSNRRIRRARCLSDLLRFQGDYAEAARWAEVALEAALETDYKEVRTAAFRSFIRSRLMLGSFQAARGALAAYVRDALGESRFEKYAFLLLLGDYHLALERQRLNEPLVDDQFRGPDATIPCSADSITPTSASSAMQFAIRAYRKAMAIGSEVDAKLRSEVHTRETGDRLVRCAKLVV